MDPDRRVLTRLECIGYNNNMHDRADKGRTEQSFALSNTGISDD